MGIKKEEPCVNNRCICGIASGINMQKGWKATKASHGLCRLQRSFPPEQVTVSPSLLSPLSWLLYRTGAKRPRLCTRSLPLGVTFPSCSEAGGSTFSRNEILH